MAVDLLATVFWPLLAGLLASFAIEAPLTPRPRLVWRRPRAAGAIHLGLWLLAFAALLALLARPWFAASLVSAFLLLVVLVSRAKSHSLHEPFVFQDFEYFTDTLRHPRLYLPFFGWFNFLLATLAFLAAVYVGWRFETSLHERFAMAEFITGVAAPALAGTALLWFHGRRPLAVSFQPEDDLRRLGLLASLWAYGRAERIRPAVASPFANIARCPAGSTKPPHLVVVQSESFFDARRAFAGVRQDILAGYDTLLAEAVLRGPLEVPAFGANTVRSEFAFLSGLDPAQLDVHRFNPYRKLPHWGVPTLAGHLRKLGYRTVCIHPYPAGFYRRDVVFPLLGFDRFIDIREFADAEYFGPYVSDAAVAEKIAAVLGEAGGQPLFVFAITMENHGPLHLERVSREDVGRYHSSPPAPGCEDFTVYLRHLANAGRMAAALRDTLNALPREAWLAWFGDHVPILPRLYADSGVPDGRTDYFIWRNGDPGEPGRHTPLRAQELGVALLGLALPGKAPVPDVQNHNT
jgi:phosphoglycerol transferase MdoB-like AlkP superfamily enzyme